jgi:hypothetical protein
MASATLTHKNNSCDSIVTTHVMFNYVMGSYNHQKKLSYNLQSPELLPILTSSTNTLKLPDIYNKNGNLNNSYISTKIKPVDCCISCNIHLRQGCTNNLKKNGSKIWYVLHNLVESIKTPHLTNEDFERVSTAIVMIIRSVPCRECMSHSLLWYKSVVKNNTKLQTRIHLIYEVWKHHDDITKEILMAKPNTITKRLTWNEYKKRLEIDKITCSHFMIMNNE